MLSFLLVVCTILLTTGCNSYSDETRYVAVKCVNSEMWSILDIESGEILQQDEFKEEPSKIVNDIFYIRNENGTYDFYNINDVKKPLNETSYKDVTSFCGNGLALVVKKGGTIEIVNTKGKVIKDLGKDIEKCRKFYNGLAVVTDYSGKMGYINEDGDIVIKPSYDIAHNFYASDYALVGKEEQNGIINYSAIDKKGNVLFSFSSSEYEDIVGFNGDYLGVIHKDNFYYLGLDGKKITNKEFGKSGSIANYLCQVHNNISVFYDGTGYGLKNTDGEIQIRAKYDLLVYRDDDTYEAQKQGKYGLINSKDEIILGFDYDNFDYINNHRFIVGDEKTKSLIDQEGKDVSKSNFIKISDEDSRYVTSNYFNAAKVAREVADLFNEGTCGRASKSTTLNNLSDLIVGSAYSNTDEYVLTETGDVANYAYCFSRALAKRSYDYIYGYRYQSGVVFDYSNPIHAVIITKSVKEYDQSAEKSFVKAFESLLSSKGFTKSDKEYFYRSKYGNNVAVGYNEGTIIIYYWFDDNIIIPVQRNEREIIEETDANSGATASSDSDSIVVEDTVATW